MLPHIQFFVTRPFMERHFIEQQLIEWQCVEWQFVVTTVYWNDKLSNQNFFEWHFLEQQFIELQFTTKDCDIWSVCDLVVFAHLQCELDPRTSGRMDCDVIDVNSASDESAKESCDFHVHGSHL